MLFVHHLVSHMGRNHHGNPVNTYVLKILPSKYFHSFHYTQPEGDIFLIIIWRQAGGD